MHNKHGLELYWEDVGERVIYAQLDDYAWKLPEKFFKYKKERSLYIYHDEKLAAFYSRKDTQWEATLGSRYFQLEKNVQKIITLKKNLWRKTQQALASISVRQAKNFPAKELQQQLMTVLAIYHQALSTHYLTQPQFFELFEQGKTRLPQQTITALSKARFRYTRRAWTAAMEACRLLFQEYARRHGLTLAQAFGMTSHRHAARVYVGATVDDYISAYEQYKDITEVKGIIGNQGSARGEAFVVTNENLDLKKLPKGMKKGMVLIAQNAWPEFLPYYKLAAAMVTNEGGITSHGVVVSRELCVPCVVGTKIATKVFKTGDWVTVDADKGVVKKINLFL